MPSPLVLGRRRCLRVVAPTAVSEPWQFSPCSGGQSRLRELASLGVVAAALDVEVDPCGIGNGGHLVCRPVRIPRCGVPAGSLENR